MGGGATPRIVRLEEYHQGRGVTGGIRAPYSVGFGDSKLQKEVLHFMTSLAGVKLRAWAKLNDKTW